MLLVKALEARKKQEVRLITTVVYVLIGMG